MIIAAGDAVAAVAALRMRWRVRILILLGIAGYAAGARADAGALEFAPQVWLNPGIYAQHFDSSKGLRNNNIGVGAEVWLSRDHALMGGSFINSNRARSHYGAYQWRPLHWQISGLDVGAGIAVGAFDGYPNYRNGAWFVAPLPMLSIEGRRLGANISLIPTVAKRFDGALAVQVKLRVW
ncbi:MAG: hypothetical protein D4R74_04195 [Betaproteobacteria bacterium]|nr:MAG: hypothetical protein D4R74_04195 [Betaproteobacteria bacterium]